MSDQTWNQRIKAIMREEREASMAAIEALSFPNEVKIDVPDFWRAVQDAIGEVVARKGRTLDGRIVPTTLRMMADEHERVWRRMQAQGLNGPAQAPGNTE